MGSKIISSLPYILLAILGTVVWKLLVTTSDLSSSIKDYEIEIEALQTVIDSLDNQNTLLESQADSLIQASAQADGRIQLLTENLYETRQKAKKILSTVESFSDSELEKFFTDRYSYLQDTVK